MFAVFSNHMHPRAGRRSGQGPVLSLMAMFALRRQRRQLRDLDDAQLADIGLTRYEAEVESRRPAWDVPAGWRR